MSQTLLYSHAAFANHEVPPGHVEHPGRYRAVEDAFRAEEFADLQRLDAPRAQSALAGLAHVEAYCATVTDAHPEQGLVQLDADTFMGPSSLEATLRAAAAATDAVDRIISGTARNAFILSRPPGHHAEPDRAMGFCLFNHAAIAALYARHKYALERVAIVDFDVHHGNGTESIFWNDENAFFGSSHEWPQYPGTGRVTDRGAYDNIVNAPLSTGANGQTFRRAWGESILPALNDFAPELIVVSAGFDAHQADPLGGLMLDEGDFAWVTEEIAAIAKSTCRSRIVSVLEGGYDLDALGTSAAAHGRALLNAR